MKKSKVFALSLMAVFAIHLQAGEVDGGAVLGSAIGAAAGSAIGSAIGGKEGAIIGGGVGGATGAAVGRRNEPVQTGTRVTREGVIVPTQTVIVQGKHHRDNGKHLGQYKHQYKNKHHGNRD